MTFILFLKELSELVSKLRSLIAVRKEPSISFPYEVWEESLRFHDDPDFFDYIKYGNRNGYHIGIKDYKLIDPNKRNLPCNIDEKIAITKWIIKCIIEKGNIYGPFRDLSDVYETVPCVTNLAVCPMGAVPKEVAVDGTVESHRVITNLSAPKRGTSVNSSIPKERKAVEYMYFLEVVDWVHSLGKGAWIWTADAQDAYLRVPVHKSDWRYLGFMWFGMFFIICSLPFGLASACQIYTAFADAVLWIILHNCGLLFFENDVYNLHHYMDDFFGGSIDKNVAKEQLKAVLRWFEKLGIPTRASKCHKPSQRPKILGFVYDTLGQCVRVPNDKIEKYLLDLRYILTLKRVKKKRLLQLIGKLRWASMVIFPGSAFVRHLENAAYRYDELWMMIPVNVEMKREIQWWIDILPTTRNGIPFDFLLRTKKTSKFDVEIFTDASTSWGVGGYQLDSGTKWFRHEWISDLSRKPDIVFEELLGVCTAVRLWGHTWKGKFVKINCDNMGVVEMLKRKCCVFKREDLMELIRIIGRSAAKNGFYFRIFHIKGKDNKIADGLSRKENIDMIFKDEIIGSGYDCFDLVQSLMDCWNLNTPDIDIVEKCNDDFEYCVHGWDKYKLLRKQQSHNSWSVKHSNY